MNNIEYSENILYTNALLYIPTDSYTKQKFQVKKLVI